MITKRQKRVLDYIKSYSKKKEYAPSLEEIRKHFKLASVSTVHFHISKLEEEGYLEREKNRARSLKVPGKRSLMEVPLPDAINSDDVLPLNSPGTLETKRSQSKLRRKMPLNKIILGDAVAELMKLPDESCDVIIIDPPYNIGKNFGNNGDKRDLADYVAWSKEWIDESIRAIKPTGTIFIYGFSEIIAYLSVQIPINKRWLIWHYTNKNVASLNFWQRSHEAIICAWKDKPIFNRDEVREPYTEGFLSGAAGKVRKDTVGRFSKGGKTTVYKAHSGGALPRDVIKVPALAGGAGMIERWFLCKTCDGVFEPRGLKDHRTHEVIKHPTQKPLELSRKLILSSAPEKGGVVLAPFAGTGSECVVAKQLGHSYIGFEINPDYVKLAKEFISSAGRL